MNAPSLLTTIQEAIPSASEEELHVAEWLITARFHVLPKGGRTDDGLPVLLLLPKNVDISVSLTERYAQVYGASILNCHPPLNKKQQTYDEDYED